MLSFAYPWTFVLLPLPWLLRVMLPPQRASRIAVRVPFGSRLQETLGSPDSSNHRADSRWQLVTATLVWLLVLAAVARPQWIEAPITQTLPTRDLLLLVDLSSSMDQEDFTSSKGEQVNRLAAVKEVLGDFLERRDGDRIGLVVFGDAPYLQAPFSTDLQLSRQLLDQCEVGMAGPRTALGDAIGLGVNLFDESDAPAKTMIALTDGNDTKSRVPPVEAARVAAQREIRIYTVAIGDPTTAGEDKLDEQTLKEVASAAGGSYFFAADRDRLQGIYTELDQLETREVNTVSHRPRRDLYFWLLAVALALSMSARLWVALAQHVSPQRSPQQTSVHVNPITGKLEMET